LVKEKGKVHAPKGKVQQHDPVSLEICLHDIGSPVKDYPIKIALPAFLFWFPAQYSTFGRFCSIDGLLSSVFREGRENYRIVEYLQGTV
jgi:hypothetical protein